MNKLKTLISRLKLFCELEIALVEKLEEVDKRVYALEQDNVRTTASLRSYHTEFLSLEKVVGRLKRNDQSV